MIAAVTITVALAVTAFVTGAAIDRLNHWRT